MPQIGEFDPHLRPILRLILRGSLGREQTVEFRLNTGFDLSLAVLTSVVDALDLAYVKTRTMYVASGETFPFAEYNGRVMWEGIERPIRILENPGVALAGIALFSGYNLSLEVFDGGAISYVESTYS